MNEPKIQIEKVLAIAKVAGKAIMEIYEKADFSKIVDYKADNSPLTTADKEAHRIIEHGLKSDFPNIPILSEEGADIPHDQRKQWPLFWMVDPLDGTKEFINKNGEFTVNIALIDNQRATMGIVYAPAINTAYYGTGGTCWKQIGEEDPKIIQVNQRQNGRIAVRSKSHASEEEEEVLSKYEVKDTISVGSSLKFCMLAEGKADVYYRHGPTMEWDTAAGQAVVEAAGGKVYRGHAEGQPFLYNNEKLLNGSFLALGF